VNYSALFTSRVLSTHGALPLQ